MKKTQLFFLAFCSIGFLGLSQNSNPPKQEQNVQHDQRLTSLKPADASPMVFSSLEEMNAKKQSKMDATRDLIRQNINNPELVKQYRENLWRIENAKVSEPNK